MWKWIRFIIGLVLIVLCSMWGRSLWWLLLLVPLFDLSFTHKVYWLFWRKDCLASPPKGVRIGEDILIALFLALFLRTYVFSIFMVSSTSMANTLLVGDFVIVDKLVYGPRSFTN